MDGFELNKIAAAIIAALLVGMVATLVSKAIIKPQKLTKNIYIVQVPEEEGAGPVIAETKEVEPIEAFLAQADVKKGQQIAQKVCAQCHSFEKEGVNKIGPNLWNVVGNKIAQKEGFAYSSVFKSKDMAWDYSALNKFLFKPRDFLNGTKMSFVGLAKTQDRADLIAYLRTLSSAPVALP